MNLSPLVFLDNSIHKIFKTIEVLKRTYTNLSVFNKEEDLIEYLKTNNPEIIFLNLDLQPNDAVAVLKEVQNKKNINPPFTIIYSEKLDDFVQELAFNAGADGFINFHHKPAVMDLYLKNLFSRRLILHPSLIKKEIVIDNDRYLVFKNGESFQLPRKEFRLFELLFINSGKFFSKPEIALALWNDSSIANKRIIDVHIYNIRQIFGKQVIQSQKGKGYRVNQKHSV